MQRARLMAITALQRRIHNITAGRWFAPRLAAALILAFAVAAIGARSSVADSHAPPAARLALTAEGHAAAYWLDGTVNLLLTATLRNEGDAAFAGARRVAVSCEKNGAAVRGCARAMSISLPDGFGPASRTLSVRAPIGELDVTMDYGADEPLKIKVVVPERALGVDRNVFSCFSDRAHVGTLRQSERGVGCGGWASETINKWDQANPVKVWASGFSSWTRQFRDAFEEVADLSRLEVEWVSRLDDAEIVARIGARGSSYSDLCSLAAGEIGCSDVTVNEDGEITGAGILVRGGSASFSSLSELNRRRALSAIYRETIHALSMMRHRAEPGSVMEENHAGAVELSPMDEALLRLHGDPAIKPGTALDDVLDFVVFKDDLLDSRSKTVLPNPALDKWLLARGAHRAMVNGERTRFRMSATSALCETEFDDAGYEGGNIDDALGRFGWVKLTYGNSDTSPVDFTIETAPGTVEYWERSTSRWWRGEEDDYRENTEGWRRDIADPYRLLTLVLLHADWSESGGMSDAPGGGKRMDFDMNMRIAAPGEDMARLRGSLTIDPNTYALTAFEAAWELENQLCNAYRVAATEGETGGEFEIPPVVRQTSKALDVCAADLGAIDGELKQRFRWFRHCVPVAAEGGAADDFERSFDFSIGDWLILRVEAEVRSGAATRIRLDRSAGNGVWTEAARGEGAGLANAWAQRLLPPGAYRVVLTTGAHHAPESFDLVFSSSETGPPPYEFRSAAPGGEHTCGLLDNGSVVCWGRNESGQTATPLGYRFLTVAAGGKHTCALRRDGVPVCWGSDEYGQSSPPRFQRFTDIAAGSTFTCGLKRDGTADCWGSFAESGGSRLYRQRLRSLSAGGAHACGVTDSGATCWGANERGQATPPTDLRRTRRVVAGGAHSCALDSLGNARCWGANDHGQATPPAGAKFKAIAAGGNLTCAIKRDDGSAACWGELDERTAAAIPAGERFTDIYASQEHSCVIREDDGLPSCWGRDEYGQASPPSDWPLTPLDGAPTTRPTRGAGL